MESDRAILGCLGSLGTSESHGRECEAAAPLESGEEDPRLGAQATSDAPGEDGRYVTPFGARHEPPRRLPRAIWIAGSRPVAVYRGTPLEMVQAMGGEMEPTNLTVSEVVEALAAGLAENRGVLVKVSEEEPEDKIADLFVCKLLETGIGRPVPEVLSHQPTEYNPVHKRASSFVLEVFDFRESFLGLPFRVVAATIPLWVVWGTHAELPLLLTDDGNGLLGSPGHLGSGILKRAFCGVVRYR